MTQYYRPKSIKKALKLMDSLEGSYALLYFSPRGKHIMEWQTGDLIDLSETGLDTLKFKRKEVLIGALVSFETLAKSEEIKSLWSGVLSESARMSATMALRNLATLGGALLNPLFPAEVILTLLALNAEVVLVSSDTNEKRIPLDEFLSNGKPLLANGQLISAVAIPLHAKTRCALERVARTKSSGSIVSLVVSAQLGQKKARNLRIAVYGASPAPKRFYEAEKGLLDDALTAASIEHCVSMIAAETEAVSDYLGSAEYRTAMAVTLTKRALNTLKKQIRQ